MIDVFGGIGGGNGAQGKFHTDPVTGALVYGTWTFQSGYGLHAPSHVREAVTSTDAGGRYRIPRLDDMLEGQGYFRGSSILVSGTAGSGKTSIANFFTSGHGLRSRGR